MIWQASMWAVSDAECEASITRVLEAGFEVSVEVNITGRLRCVNEGRKSLCIFYWEQNEKYLYAEHRRQNRRVYIGSI